MKRLSFWIASASSVILFGVGSVTAQVDSPILSDDLMLTGSPALVAMATTTAPTPGGAAAPDEARFAAMLNQERAAQGLPALTYDPQLAEVARAHSREMAEKGYFSHESPTASLRRPTDRYRAMVRGSSSYLLVGENLFYCSVPGVERGHRALMASEGHRKNILDRRYERVGVGTYTAPDGQYWVTQMFLTRRN